MSRFTKELLAAAIAMCVASTAGAYTGSYTPGDGINGTVHDLGTPGANGMSYGASPADPQQRICIYCHAPHNTYRLSVANNGPGANVGAGPQADDAFTYLPLWNHTLQTDLNYQTYNNGPGAPQSGDHASQAMQNGMTPGSVSLLCLSCHDGSVAVNSYGNADQIAASQSNQSNVGTRMAQAYQIGKDKYLGNHHPIGFNYDDVQAADTEINSADAAQLTPTSFVRDHLYGGGNVECGTCHSVHNKGNNGERLLWRSDQNSELCLTCHNKGTYTAP